MSALLSHMAALMEQGDLETALAQIEQQVQHAGDQDDCMAVMAAIAFRQNRLAQAIQLLEPLARMDGQASDVPEILAILNAMAGRLTEALFYAKFATTTPMTQQLLPLFGPGLPTFRAVFQAFTERPLLIQARRMIQIDLFQEALTLVEQHLLLFPNDAEGLDVYALVLQKLDRHREAVGILRSVLTLAGPSATLYNRLGQCLVALGQVEDGLSCHRQAVLRAPANWAFLSGLLRDWGYSPWRDCAAGRQARAGLQDYLDRTALKQPRPALAARLPDVLTIGILCSGLHDADSKAMIAALARSFDRSTCYVVGFGEGEMGHALNLPYRDAFQNWRNCSDMDELTLATVMRGEGVDVLLDADGLLSQGRYGVMRHHGAPLQLAWLNGAEDFDLPGCHGDLSEAPQGSLLLTAGELAELQPQAPAQRHGHVTFAADASLAEMNSEVVATWAALLHRVPDSLLLLRDHGFTQPESLDRLITMFGNYGVSHRIDVVQQADGAALFGEADVALAPFPALRPLAYGPALAHGVPVVLYADSGPGRRFARTLSGLAGAAEGVVSDCAAYVEQAVALVADLEALAERRRMLRQAVAVAAVFQPDAMARQVETHVRTLLAQRLERGE